MVLVRRFYTVKSLRDNDHAVRSTTGGSVARFHSAFNSASLDNCSCLNRQSVLRSFLFFSVLHDPSDDFESPRGMTSSLPCISRTHTLWLPVRARVMMPRIFCETVCEAAVLAIHKA